jgi:hypothetical protein
MVKMMTSLPGTSVLGEVASTSKARRYVGDLVTLTSQSDRSGPLLLLLLDINVHVCTTHTCLQASTASKVVAALRGSSRKGGNSNTNEQVRLCRDVSGILAARPFASASHPLYAYTAVTCSDVACTGSACHCG